MKIEIFNNNFLYLELAYFGEQCLSKVKFFYYNKNVFDIEKMLSHGKSFFAGFRIHIKYSTKHKEQRKKNQKFFNEINEILDNYHYRNSL
jgi:hypothetical protein